jgi:hypothetical protein
LLAQNEDWNNRTNLGHDGHLIGHCLVVSSHPAEQNDRIMSLFQKRALHWLLTASASTVSHQTACVMATTEDGGLLTELLEGKDGCPEQFGSVLNFEFQSDGAATLLCGMVMADEPVQHHVVIVADP